MSRLRLRLRRTTTLDERGVTMVETAIVTPVLMLFLFGVFNCAFLMGAHLNTRYGAEDGARSGAVAAKATAADYDVIQSVKRASVAGQKNSLVRVIVYNATNLDTPVPTDCLNSPVGVTGRCNVYAGADLDQPAAKFSDPTWGPANRWPAANRQASRLNGASYLGVYVEVKTGVWFSQLPQKVSSTSVTQLEATEY